MNSPVKAQGGRRTRREERTELTRRRIVEAATALFDSRGYAATTMEAIAERADVAVETVYSRFRTKANLLGAILEPAIVGAADGRDLFDRPEIAEIRQCTDQRAQVRMLARFSSGPCCSSVAEERVTRRWGGFSFSCGGTGVAGAAARC